MKVTKTILLGIALAAGLCGYSFELGKADAVIYYSKQYKNAADELAGYLNRIYGKKYSAVPGNGKTDAPGIYLGIAPAGMKFKDPVKKLYIRRWADDTRLFLFGNDDKKLKLQGSRFAMYDFLQDVCGVRWLWPGKTGTVVEKRSPDTVKNGSSIYIPPFDQRLTQSFHYGKSYMDVSATADLDAWLDHHKVGTILHGSFAHAFSTIMPQSKYGKTHPEYYSLVTAENWIGVNKPEKAARTVFNDGAWQLCTSNPEVRKIIADQIVAKKSTRLQTISPNDGYGFCECDNCRKDDGDTPWKGAKNTNFTNRMYKFAADIANQVYQKDPDSKVAMFAYSLYNKVPTVDVKFPGNMYLSFCYQVLGMSAEAEKELEETLLGLSKTGARVVGREYWGCHYWLDLPVSHSRRIDRNLKLLHKANAAGIYGETGNAFAPRATDLYILARLSWDPTLDREALLMDFCEKAFGKKAAKVMYDMFEKIEDYTEDVMQKFNTEKGELYTIYPNVYAERIRFFRKYYGREFQKMCNKYLWKANKFAETPEHKARIAYIKLGIEHCTINANAMEGFAKLAAAGINMPLTQPDVEAVVMEKENLLKIANQAYKAADKRLRFLLKNSADNALGRDVFRSESIRLRPWKTLSEFAVTQLMTDQFNYLVNGSFEYRTYCWDWQKSSGDSSLDTTSAVNFDPAINLMAQYHNAQGRSAAIKLGAKSSAVLVNTRPVAPKTAQTAWFKMFVKSPVDPAEVMKVTLGGKELPMVVLPRELNYDRQWYEVRFQQLNIPAGKHQLKIDFKNDSDKVIEMNLDELELRLVPAK